MISRKDLALEMYFISFSVFFFSVFSLEMVTIVKRMDLTPIS